MDRDRIHRQQAGNPGTGQEQGAAMDTAEPAAKPAVLVIDEAFLVRWKLRERLSNEGFRVLEAASASDARSQFRQEPAAVLLDTTLAGRPSLDLLAEFLAARPQVPVLLMRPPGAADPAEKARAIGARGVLPMPLDLDKVSRWLQQLVAGRSP